jgi:predicted DsbA family dithiol-disulfide isomerase
MAHVKAFFEARGLRYNPHPHVVPNSRAALRLAELARSVDAHGAFHAALMDAYWDEGRDIGDAALLRELASAVDLPARDVNDVLASDRFLDVIETSTRQAVSIGATGVPAFRIDRRLLVVGAQPETVFEQAFEQLATTPSPPVP